MWRNFVAAFERSLVLASKPLPASNARCGTVITKVSVNHRSISSALALLRNDFKTEKASRDAEYIVPYKAEYEKLQSSQELVNTLRTRFRFNDNDIDKIMCDAEVLKHYRNKSLLLSLDLLVAEGVAKQNFVEYPWVITLGKASLIEKIDIIKSMQGFRDINDFVPFLRLKSPRLRRLASNLNKEAKSIPFGNRVYYIADKLQVPASTVTKFLVMRLFVLETPFEMFKSNLEYMLKYNVESKNILKDLWAFRYAPRSVEMRLKRAKSAKKDKIMPWMVRCPESVLQKSLQISLDDLEILGNRTTAEYVADRLGFTAQEAQVIMNSHPQVNSVRVTKIKEVLDYLLDEVKFTRFEVATVPRILCHSLETTKQRIEELKQYGCRPTSLVIVCKSKKEYNKFLDSWIENYNPNKTKTVLAKDEIKEENQS